MARRFGRHVALRAADLDLRAGEALALIGPNGAGKSTLLSILAGALPPTEGTVRTREGLRVGWVPQRPAHYGRLSPRENLELFARLEGLDDPERTAAELLERVDLPRDGRPAAQLSGGNQQRLNLAIAVLADPDVLLLDEPTAALDPPQRRRLWELAGQVRGRGGAIAFATQNLEEMARFADRVAVLVDGAVVFAGPLDDYASTPHADVFA